MEAERQIKNCRMEDDEVEGVGRIGISGKWVKFDGQSKRKDDCWQGRPLD